MDDSPKEGSGVGVSMGVVTRGAVKGATGTPGVWETCKDSS